MRQIDARHTAAVGELDHGGTYFRFISITSDGGATWKNEFDSTSKVELLPLFDIDFSDTLTGIATGPDQATSIPVVHLFTTHNGGSSWNEASIIPSYIDSTPASRFRIHSYGGEEFAAYLTYYSGAGVDSVVYHTLDDWQTVDSTNPIFGAISYNMGDTIETDLDYTAFRGEDTIVALAGMYINPNSVPVLGLFQSLDAGANWSRIDFPDTVQGLETSFTISQLDGNLVFLGGLPTIGRRIYVSMDHGMSWELDTLIAGDTIFPASEIPQFPVIASAESAEENGEFAVAIFTEQGGALAPDGSSYLARIEKVTSGVKESIIPVQDEMVYPNPSENTLTLDFPAGTISILDPLGRSYTVPRNGNTLDISLLPSGVYFVSDGNTRAKFVKE